MRAGGYRGVHAGRSHFSSLCADKCELRLAQIVQRASPARIAAPGSARLAPQLAVAGRVA
jgi:hypothetical protein